MPLVKHQKFLVGHRVEYTVKGVSKKGTVVYIFKKMEIPKKKRLFLYYGPEVVNPKYGRLFGPMFEDRLVVQKDDDNGYTVFPMAGWGRYFDIRIL